MERLLVDEWPEKGWNKAVLLKTKKDDGCHLVLGLPTHAYLLRGFLESRKIPFEPDDRLGYYPPKAKGEFYESVGMGEFNISMFGEEPVGVFTGMSETYKLMITDVPQVSPVIEFHRRNGVLLPKYKIVVRSLDRVAYSP